MESSILLDDPREVDVVAIERELALLWKSATDETASEFSSPVTRACSLNFIVMSETDAGFDAFAEVIGEVTLVHPARTFLIGADRRSPKPTLLAFISARCSLPVPGGKQVCCEQININAAGMDVARIPSIITSLLVPDVPTVLLWKGGMERSDAALISLLEIADKVLVDSSEHEDPGRALMTLEKFLEEFRGRTTFSDLAWGHCAAWRSVVAQMFQPAEMRGVLKTISAIRIEYSASHSPAHTGSSQAMLMAGWLASRLQWETVRSFSHDTSGEGNALFRLDDREISASIRKSGDKAGRTGELESLVISFVGGGETKFERSETPNCMRVTVRVGDKADESREFLKERSEEDLLIDELGELSPDSVYEGSVAALALTAGGAR